MIISTTSPEVNECLTHLFTRKERQNVMWSKMLHLNEERTDSLLISITELVSFLCPVTYFCDQPFVFLCTTLLVSDMLWFTKDTLNVRCNSRT